MRIFCFFAFLLTLITPTSAQQPLTRDETLAVIARSMDEIQKTQINATPLSYFAYEAHLKRISDLKDKLRDNPYVRVKGFTIGFPSGASVDFEFKD